MAIKEKTIIEKIQLGKKRLDGLTGQKRLEFLLTLLKTSRLYSPKTAEDLIDENLELIETIVSEASALLLGEKAFFASKKHNLSEAKKYADKALSLSREIGSSQAEARALTVKGYLEDAVKQHKKAAAWHTMALEKSSQLQRSNAALELGTSYSKQGEYDRAWFYINEAIKYAEKLIRSKIISKDEKNNQIKIQADAWSRLATLHESIDDLHGAQNAYERSIALAKKYSLVWEQYKALSRKVKFFILSGNLIEAESSLKEAESLPLKGRGPRAPLYIAHDWARLYRAQSRYSEAQEKYRGILYGASSDKEARERHLLDLMNNTADLFGEILSGIHDCLVGMGKKPMAERLDVASRAYEDVLTESGIYKEVDKQTRIRIQENNIVNLLADIFQKTPRVVRYKDIFVEYDSEKGKAKVTKNGREFELNKRAFLILRYFVEHKGECVTLDELHQFWIEHKEGYQSKEGLRTYIQRDIRKKLGLNQYLERCPKPKGGWLLLP